MPSGVSALDVVGNGTAIVTVTASLDQINATLANATGLLYHPNAGFGGPDTLTVTTDDLGHNGGGGAQTDIDTLAIAVDNAPVADAKSVTTAEDNATTITLSASGADGDPDSVLDSLTASARVGWNDRLADVQLRDSKRLHRRRPLHTGRRLQRPRQLHLLDLRRPRLLRVGDGVDHG